MRIPRTSLISLAPAALAALCTGAPLAAAPQEPQGPQDNGNALEELLPRVVVAAADVNRDRRVTDKEWGKLIKHLAPKKKNEVYPLAPLMEAILLRSLDADGDKKLEWSDLDLCFATWDLSADDRLDVEELRNRGRSARNGQDGADSGGRGGGRGGRGGGPGGRGAANGRGSNNVDPLGSRVIESVFRASDAAGDADGEVLRSEWHAFLGTLDPKGVKKKRRGAYPLEELARVFVPEVEEPAEAEGEEGGGEGDGGDAEPEPRPAQPRSDVLGQVPGLVQVDDEGLCPIERLQALYAELDTDGDGDVDVVELSPTRARNDG